MSGKQVRQLYAVLIGLEKQQHDFARFYHDLRVRGFACPQIIVELV